MTLAQTGFFHTSKSRLAVDREFMYIGSAGPGRADGRKARRADGRAVGRPDGRADGRKGRFGAPVPIFIAKMKKWLRKDAISIVFFDFSNHPNAQVPIFTVQNTIFGHGRRAPGSTGSTGNATRSVVHNPRNTRARGQDDGSSKQTPSN